MFKTIYKREIQHNLISLRFQIAFVMILGVFVIGTLSYIKGYQTRVQNYGEIHHQFIETIKNDIQANASELATNERSYQLAPRSNGFISDCKEKYLPNAISFSAYNVFSFVNRSGSTNPFLYQFQELNWSFIATLIISFIVLLFTFDAVSGEKETRTLAITLSNSLSRGTLLFGKYASAITTTMLITVIGMIFSVLIILISNQVALSGQFVLEGAGFLLLQLLLISSMAAFGLLSSVLVKNSNISLLIALTFWLIFAVVIPNSSAFFARKIFAIEQENVIQAKISQAFDDINRNAPEGSWAMNSSLPFAPEHRMRADLQMKLLEAAKLIRDGYYQAMFRQFERTRYLTSLSPLALFEYMTESVVGGGYARFKKVWNDMLIYQSQLLSFFKDLDMSDPDSPHWYNPREDVSTTRKPVTFEKVPLFEEQAMSLAERFSSVLIYLIIYVAYTGIIFFVTFVLLVRYDVR
ncbi:MAG: ABC transporter permease [bacterium]|jgi:ABC-type transport system involved in multi-copper enzyme maturation permease subunit|nr:ABC transporter permease [bacterium]